MHTIINNMIEKQNKNKISNGFTIVELIVVISIIGILAAVSIVSYGNWQQSVVAAQLKSDLNGVATAMESYRNFNNGYPITVPSTFNPSPDVTLTGGSSNGIVYCVDALSSKSSSIHYYIDQSLGNKGAQSGTCASRPIIPAAPVNLVATAVSSSTINLSWSAVVGATSYNVQQSSNSSFTNVSTVATPTDTSTSSSSLTTVTTYYYRVAAVNSTGQSSWSISANATTPPGCNDPNNQYGTYPDCYAYDALPIATSIEGYWTTAPSGYLLEDGSAVSRTTYSDLFAAIGTTYGAGNGSTTFNLPDSRGRVAVNKSSDTEFDTIGKKSGEKVHTLTGAESGEKGHNHSQNAHNHTGAYNDLGQILASNNGSQQGGYGGVVPNTGNSSYVYVMGAATATNIAVAASNASSAHNTIQPSIVKTFAIKYRPATGSDSMLSASTSIAGYFIVAPSGYLLEDGSAVSRTTYADLFAVIGTTYGSGNGSTTFNLPDSRGRITVNKSPTDTEFDTIGEKYGEKVHTLTGAESGEKGHNHSQNAHNHTGANNDLGQILASNYGAQQGGYGGVVVNTGNSSYVYVMGAATATNIAVAAANASSAHNTIQPSIVKVLAIKYTLAAGSVDNSAKGTSISGYWSTAPTSYLLEDGSAVSRTTYADLFAAIGTTYGVGNGSTTFNLPDSRGRVTVNNNPSDAEFATIGQKYGEKTHLLTGAESGLISHNHSQNAHNHTGANNDLGQILASNYGAQQVGYGGVVVNTGNSSYVYVMGTTTATNQAVAASNASSAHNTIQPSIVQNFAIRY